MKGENEEMINNYTYNLNIMKETWGMTLDEMAELFKHCNMNKHRVQTYLKGTRPTDCFYLAVEEKTGIPYSTFIKEKISRLDIPDRPYKKDDNGELYYLNSLNERITQKSIHMQSTESTKVVKNLQKDVEEMKKQLAELKKEKEQNKA